MSEEQTQTNIEQEDWRQEVSTEPKNTLKVADGEVKTFVFLNEGVKHTHSDFGDSIVFSVSIDEDEMNWYVNPNNFDLLGQIKSLGKLVGLKVEVERHGSKKSDTRYTIKESK